MTHYSHAKTLSLNILGESKNQELVLNIFPLRLQYVIAVEPFF